MGASFFFADFFAGDFSHTLLSKDGAVCEIRDKPKLLSTPTNLPVWYFRPRLDVKTLEHFGHVRFEPSSMSSFLLPLASKFDAADTGTSGTGFSFTFLGRPRLPAMLLQLSVACFTRWQHPSTERFLLSAAIF
jgi:hypothetical protein